MIPIYFAMLEKMVGMPKKDLKFFKNEIINVILLSDEKTKKQIISRSFDLLSKTEDTCLKDILISIFLLGNISLVQSLYSSEDRLKSGKLIDDKESFSFFCTELYNFISAIRRFRTLYITVTTCTEIIESVFILTFRCQYM